MAHGYLGDGYGSHGDVGDDRDDDRERGWRDRDDRWRDRDRDRGMMFGSRNERDDRWRSEREFGGGRAFGGRSQSDRGQRSFSAHPDDHYRSWRDRHMSELDRDYEEYCRDREQRFHSEFDQWRQQRHGNPQPLRTGMTQTGMSHDPSGEMQLTTEVTDDQAGADPMGDATLGTNSGSSKRR